MREMVQREREDGEGASLTRNLNASGGEVMPGVVVEQLGRNASGEPWPADTYCLAFALLAKSGECTLQRRDTGRVTVGEPDRESIDELIHGAKVIPYTWRLERCACDLDHPRAEPAGDACGSQRLQMRIAGDTRIYRFEPPGGVKQEWKRVCGAPQI